MNAAPSCLPAARTTSVPALAAAFAMLMTLLAASCGGSGGSSGGPSTIAADTPATAPPPTPSSAVAPNLLVIISDDIGLESLTLVEAVTGSGGAVATPNIAQLAAAGVVFDQAWAYPVCSPTRAAILTGQYGNRTGVLYAGDVLAATTDNLFKTLTAQSAGRYAIGVFGKWHLAGPVGTVQHVRNSGVATFRGFLAGDVPDYFNWTVFDADGTTQNSRTYVPSAITDFALDFLRTHRQSRPQDPWFAWVAYNSAHSPFQVPPANLHSVDVGGLAPGTRSTSLAVYRAMIQAMDSEIGRLLAQVDLATTTVVFIGDNGTPAAVKAATSGVRGSKESVYEGGVRVPLVIAGAGVTRRGHDSTLIAATDLHPTLLTLARASDVRSDDGVSFAARLSDATAPANRRIAFTELCVGTTARYAVRDPRHKLLFDGTAWGLYDLQSDPREARNLYVDPALATIRAELQSALDDVRSRSTRGCFR